MLQYQSCIKERDNIGKEQPKPQIIDASYKYLAFPYIPPPTQSLAESATNVSGWTHVKHLNKNATDWYPENTEEGRSFFVVQDEVFDSYGSFTKPFPDTFDELLFTRSDGNGNVDRFLYCLKSDVESIIAFDNWVYNIPSIKTHDGNGVHFRGFGRNSGYVNRAPMILSRNSFTSQEDYLVYVEHHQTSSTNEGLWIGKVANKQYDVFARKSGVNVSPQYTVNFPENTTCDVLIVGGGGAGGKDRAGGGGAGGLVFKQGLTLNGDYNIFVGDGGLINSSDGIAGGSGGDSIFDTYTVLGGGGGGPERVNANNGGSGGGSAYSHSLSHYGDGLQPASASGGFGNRGGDARNLSLTYTSRGAGGGGGAGGRGLEATNSVGGAGGIGKSGVGSIDFKTHFGLGTNNLIGEYSASDNKIYFAGGGGSGDCGDGQPNPSIHGIGGKGGGRDGRTDGDVVEASMPNSGGGGGGGSTEDGGSDGCSGVVIIRYLSQTGESSTTPVIGHLNFDGTDWVISETSYTLPIASSSQLGVASSCFLLLLNASSCF